jgi:hypothetical protein
VTGSDGRVRWLGGARAFVIASGLLLHASRIGARGVPLAATLAIHNFMILRAPPLRLLFNGQYAARA